MSVCVVVIVPYVDAVVALTVMRVMLFVLHVCVCGCGECRVVHAIQVMCLVQLT